MNKGKIYKNYQEKILATFDGARIKNFSKKFQKISVTVHELLVKFHCIVADAREI